MARQKNGTPTGFKDSKGVEIKVGDTIKGPTGIGYVRGSKVKFKDGRAPELQALMKNGNQYTVVHLSKVEKPEKGQESDFIPGQVVASDDGIMFFKGTTKSGASADVVCFWNKKSGTVQVSWVVPLKALRWASDEESKEFHAKLKEVGLSLDKRSMQALKVEPLFKKGDWVKSGNLFGQVESWSSKEITLTWACEGKNILTTPLCLMLTFAILMSN